MIGSRMAAATVAAAATALAVATLLSYVPLSGGNAGVIAQPAASLLVAALVGGLVARRWFQLPGLLAWCVYWTIVVYVLYQVAAPLGQGSIASILARNGPAIVVSAVAACAGALVARMASGRRAGGPSPASR